MNEAMLNEWADEEYRRYRKQDKNRGKQVRAKRAARKEVFRATLTVTKQNTK